MDEVDDMQEDSFRMFRFLCDEVELHEEYGVVREKHKTFTFMVPVVDSGTWKQNVIKIGSINPLHDFFKRIAINHLGFT